MSPSCSGLGTCILVLVSISILLRTAFLEPIINGKNGLVYKIIIIYFLIYFIIVYTSIFF